MGNLRQWNLLASAMAGNFGAVAWGLKHYGKGSPITHVLANRVGSDYHAELCRATLPADIAWLGALPRNLDARIERMADLLADTGAKKLPPNVDLFAASAPRFAPLLADTALPACDAVWLPGGYPELHGPALAANHVLAGALKAHVDAGKPLLNECGGMMACFDSLATTDGTEHPMFGLLPGRVRMQAKLADLGMLTAELPEGRLAGYTFHYSAADTALVVSHADIDG